MPTVAFKQTDTFVRYFDLTARVWKYMHLLERDGPIKYPFRFASLAPGSERNQPFVFEDLRASSVASHIYQMKLGLFPEVNYKIWHPYNVRLLQLDERPDDLSDDVVSILRYEDSPHDEPLYEIWTDDQRYPAVQPRNIGRITKPPRIEFNVMKFRVLFDANIDSDTKSKLISGDIPSDVITFGGEI